VLDFPVVSGNVSLYNETEGRPILPTPTNGAVGVIEDIGKSVGSRLTQAGLGIVLIGETTGWLGQSLYLREACGREEGAPPPVDLAVERRNGDFVRSQIAIGRVEACHDLSDGGLIVALAEMAIAGGTGMEIGQPAGNAVPSHAFFYGEDQGRYVIASGSADDVIEAAHAAGVPAVLLGYSGGALLVVKDLLSLPLSDIKAVHEAWLPGYMSATE
jgi:phosphoribosylformylglycinamidine synthase